MDYHVFKSAVNRYLNRFAGGSQRPVFLDPDTVMPALNTVTAAFPRIRDEFQQLMHERHRLPRYHDIDSGEAAISNATAHDWNVFMFEILGHRIDENCRRCPETCRALEAVPDRIQAFFSILDPGKSIPCHEGPYLGYLRYHLALEVPTRRAPRLIVAGRAYEWKTGEALLFDDSWPHEVQNDSDQLRAVLVVDVLRPLPRIPDGVNRLVTKVIARHTYGRQVAARARRFQPTAAARDGSSMTDSSRAA